MNVNLTENGQTEMIEIAEDKYAYFTAFGIAVLLGSLFGSALAAFF